MSGFSVKRTIVAISAALTLSAVTVGATSPRRTPARFTSQAPHVDKVAHAAAGASEVEVPTDLLAGLLMERVTAQPAPARRGEKVPPKVYAVMAVTSMLTFGTLATGYQLLFWHPLFA